MGFNAFSDWLLMASLGSLRASQNEFFTFVNRKKWQSAKAAQYGAWPILFGLKLIQNHASMWKRIWWCGKIYECCN